MVTAEAMDAETMVVISCKEICGTWMETSKFFLTQMVSKTNDILLTLKGIGDSL